MQVGRHHSQSLPMQEGAYCIFEDVPDFSGAPDTIRTCDRCLRRGITDLAADIAFVTGPKMYVIRTVDRENMVIFQ
jgi:hypothetical protein